MTGSDSESNGAMDASEVYYVAVKIPPLYGKQISNYGLFRSNATLRLLKSQTI